ncbi:PHOG protein [Sodiomyces alkalinus F11]|uniref:PHOG protein n=1 Tax=Sodiomyces alkalinus (strain CBS 110278 / VKM F-3762 / F11) TaxID=1314773 RepID=A0A3N2PPC2_SODAK|nr:PHOG protein [Sodiomyces alkalinus F11]ROT36284.1 PHOG protein [Sodiomyces alkalinus F11]
MDAFNSMPQPPLSSATPGDTMGLGSGVVDELVFGESLMDNTHGAFPTLPFTPTYDFQDFSAGFEDPFSYSAQPYEIPAPAEDPNQGSPSHELDNKLLGFSTPATKADLLDETGQHVDVSMTAELRGMFFVAEDVFGGENTGRPLELTCYRRNLWQCLGEVTVPRHVASVVDEQGNQVPVVELSASISGIESIEGKPTEIISIPWKSANPIPGEEYRASNAPPNFSLDLSSGREADASRITLNMSWKRLQFKHATANNGRRKGLQQHYIVQIILLARPQSGDWIRVAEIQSSPVIVRGRSPRNFDSKKDIPLTGDKKSDRRSNSDASAAPTQKDSNGHATPTARLTSIGSRLQHAGDWATPQAYRGPTPNGAQPAPKRLAMSPTVARPPVPAWSVEPTRPAVKASLSGPANSGPHRAGTSGPINLSLSEDERSPNMSSTDLQSPQRSKAAAVVGPASSQSPKDDEDMLYEYFPLSVDDWMPPVEAVYRPHVVHHTTMPADVKAQQLQSKLKRYFTAET